MSSTYDWCWSIDRYRCSLSTMREEEHREEEEEEGGVKVIVNTISACGVCVGVWMNKKNRNEKEQESEEERSRYGRVCVSASFVWYDGPSTIVIDCRDGDQDADCILFLVLIGTNKHIVIVANHNDKCVLSYIAHHCRTSIIGATSTGCCYSFLSSPSAATSYTHTIISKPTTKETTRNRIAWLQAKVETMIGSKNVFCLVAFWCRLAPVFVHISIDALKETLLV